METITDDELIKSLKIYVKAHELMFKREFTKSDKQQIWKACQEEPKARKYFYECGKEYKEAFNW